MKKSLTCVTLTLLLGSSLFAQGCGNQQTITEEPVVEEITQVTQEEALQQVESDLGEYCDNLQISIQEEEKQIIAIMEYEEVIAKRIEEAPNKENPDSVYWEAAKLMLDLEAGSAVRTMSDNGYEDYKVTIIVFDTENESSYMTTELGVLADSITE